VDLQIAKWGNSLALRIPSEVVRRLGLREGATVQAQISIDGTLSIRPAQWNRRAFANELTEVRNAMPISESVMQEVRSGARY
jgi:antitoxin MazE